MIPTISYDRSTAQCLSGGVFVSVMTPFDVKGVLKPEQISAQAKILSDVPGVKGLAIHRSAHERSCLSVAERVSIVRATRTGLRDDHGPVTV